MTLTNDHRAFWNQSVSNKVVIVRANDLHRDVFEFSLDWSFSGGRILFDSFDVEFKESARQRKWRRAFHWERQDRRNNTLTVGQIEAKLSEDVVAELREELKKRVDLLKIGG